MLHFFFIGYEYYIRTYAKQFSTSYKMPRHGLPRAVQHCNVRYALSHSSHFPLMAAPHSALAWETYRGLQDLYVRASTPPGGVRSAVRTAASSVLGLTQSSASLGWRRERRERASVAIDETSSHRCVCRGERRRKEKRRKRRRKKRRKSGVGRWEKRRRGD